MASASATIPVGYKQTEVGVIPKDWNVRKQGEIVDFINGRAYSRHEWETSGVPVCRLQNLTGSGDTFYYSKLKLPEKQYMEYGDLIFMWSASFGPYIWKGPRAIYHYHIWKIKCNQKYVDKSFFYHALVDMTERLKSKTSGSTMLHLTKEGMEKYLLALPKLSEQKSISKVLTDSDSLILALEHLITKKRNIKQGTIQELLTRKTRLPGFGGEWETIRLRDFLKTPVTDGPHLTPVFHRTGIPFLSVNNLVNNRVDFSELRYISEDDHIQFSKKCKPERNDILLGKAASVGKVAIVDFDLELNIWSPLALIRVNEKHDPKFVFYSFQSRNILNQIELFTNSSSQGNIGMGDIELLIFNLPDKIEQVAIAEVLSDMDAEIAALEQRLEKTKAIKQGMMQQLLTGRIRLVEPSTPVEASA